MADRFSHILLCIMILIIGVSAPTLEADPSVAPMHSLMTAHIINPSNQQDANFQKAFTQVLIKVTGNPNVMTLPTVRANLANVTNMVKSYSTSSDPLNPSQTVLAVTFNSSAIQKILTDAGQPMWDAERPKTLIWLVVNNSNSKNTVLDNDAATKQPVAVALTQIARNRGLPIFFPLLDLSDEALISKNANSSAPLTTADMQSLANRYHVDSILAGVITPEGNQWQAQWRYLLDSAPINWSQDSDTANNIAEQAINTVASTMVAQLAISTISNIQTDALLQINQVSNLQTYSQLSQCLSHLSNMTSLAPVDLNDKQVTFKVHFNGNSEQLIQTAQKNCGITYQNTTSNPSQPNNNLAVLGFIDVGTNHV